MYAPLSQIVDFLKESILSWIQPGISGSFFSQPGAKRLKKIINIDSFLIEVTYTI